jgi:hypothetical protein
MRTFSFFKCCTKKSNGNKNGFQKIRTHQEKVRSHRSLEMLEVSEIHLHESEIRNPSSLQAIFISSKK